MKRHYVLAAVATAVLLAGCGGSDRDTGASASAGMSGTRAQGGRPAAASVSAVNSTNAGFTALSTLHVGQTAYFQVLGSKLPSTLALDVTDCTGMTTLSVGATEAHYRCTPSGTAGMKASTLRHKTGGPT